MSDTLPDARAIATYLNSHGRSAMMYRGDVSLHVRIHNFPTHLHIQFRSSNVLRGAIVLPTDVPQERRELFAVKLQELNRTGLGVMAVMTSGGIGILSQVPFGTGAVPAKSVERLVACVTEHALLVYPEMTKLEAMGQTAS